MTPKYWLTTILFIASIKLYGQEVRVTNSFIILINDKLATTVEGLQMVLSDTTGKEDVTNGGYYPGVLFVKNIETKNVLFADSVRKLTLLFDYYAYGRGNDFIHNYKINIERRWFKESLIILRIFDINKRRGTYKYTFEIPGLYFSKPFVKSPD
jgi:hypothetical protein